MIQESQSPPLPHPKQCHKPLFQSMLNEALTSPWNGQTIFLEPWGASTLKWVSVALRRPPSPACVFHSLMWTPPYLCVDLVLCVALRGAS